MATAVLDVKNHHPASRCRERWSSGAPVPSWHNSQAYRNAARLFSLRGGLFNGQIFSRARPSKIMISKLRNTWKSPKTGVRAYARTPVFGDLLGAGSSFVKY